MSEQIDWSKAPEGATHRGAINWFKSDGEKVYTFDGAVWHPVSWEIWQLAPFAKRPSIHADEWSGEGLPPVGVVCMANGYQVVIVAHHCNGIHAIYAESESDGLLYYGEPNEFRLIRTPEQIAADEREEAVKDMMSHIYACLPRECGDESGPACFTLYDAGYRKP